MKRKMKYALLCMGMMLFSMQGMAQSEGSAGPEPKKEHFREIPNPEKTASIIRKSKCSRVSKRKVHFTKRSV